ncbi:hypothetical protein SELMODRAFT_93629 [Selaginella moellendorffii]|uniref:Phosphoglycolate phosphatase n=1 Tax=Selaginella moellendorffii TaxID=88036 RepID=D8RGM5_SELML|nr:hypothetical protein SELMODRAFT_93629 [Selaginella moellendorffii]
MGLVKAVLRGVVVDLDGTLRIPPTLDLRALKATVASRVYSSPKEAELALQAVERAGRSNKWALPGAAELCSFIDSKKLRRGMITRSSTRDAENFEAEELAVGSRFSPILGNEASAMKPSPQPLLRVCETWGVNPGEVLMVGDSAKDDVACGKSAGAMTCLVDPLFRYKIDELPLHQRPDFKVHSLHELKALIDDMCV